MTEVLSDATGRPSARRAQTRERLMTAAVTVFAARGIIGASVEEICEAAGFTRGAFYSNFADKDELVLALIEAGAARQYAAAEHAVGELVSEPGDRSPAELVSQTLQRYQAVGRTSRERVLVQRELMLHAARVPALHAPYTDFLDSCTQQLRRLIADALTAAGLRFVLPLDQALDLLVATHDLVEARSLLTGEDDATLLQALIMTITTPNGPGGGAGQPDVTVSSAP